MMGEDGRATYPRLEGDTVPSEAGGEERTEALSRDRATLVAAYEWTQSTHPPLPQSHTHPA